MLIQLVKHLLAPKTTTQPLLDNLDAPAPGLKSVLNVGGHDDAIALPDQYRGWRKVLLDIDPACAPDVLCDAREMAQHLPAGSYDSVYCSHNLEHYFRHDVYKVLQGFLHVLKDDGFVYIRVPDVMAAMAVALENDMDIDDVLYESGMGPITLRDLVYGHGEQIERSGVDFFAHKTGFSHQSVRNVLEETGFREVFSNSRNCEVTAIAFKTAPTPEQRAQLGLPSAEAENTLPKPTPSLLES